MDFPHLKDTKFPDIKTVDVYKYENNFNYARWQGKTSIKLMNVLWNSNYSDVPYFTSKAKRDEWFDNQAGIVKALESAFIVAPDNSVKIPIPYNVAYNYNYLVVDVPIMTSANEPIDYENENNRIERWYYFIDDMSQRSPSTTEVYVTCDYWTTFIHNVEIPYLMLERGHAPMFQNKVSDYLANPIANSEYLLADDFNYGSGNVIKETKYFPVGAGKKYVLFACPITSDNLSTLGGGEYSGSSSNPTFSNTSERWGYQMEVNGYEWKYGNGDYSNAKLPVTSFGNNENNVFNGNYIYAIDCVNARAFFNYVSKYAVHLMHAIEAVFVVPEELLNLSSTAISVYGYNVYRAYRKFKSTDISLTKSDFNFGSKYENITKLYTYPYSVLEMTDDNGFYAEIRLENCGAIKFREEISISFPYLQYQCFFTNVNGNTSQSYTWKNLSDGNTSRTMWESDFSKFMVKWDIPTFAIKASQENEFAVNNYADMQAKRYGALIDYWNSTRFANTTRENVADTMATNTTNIANSGATMNANQAIQNDANTDVTDEHNDANYDVTINNATTNSSITSYNNKKLEDDSGADGGVSIRATLADINAIALSTANNNACNAQLSMLNATSQAAEATGQIMLGNFGAATSAGVGILPATIGAAIQNYHANLASTISQSKEGALCTAAVDATTYKLGYAQQNNISVTGATNTNAINNTNIAIDCASNVTSINNASAASQTSNTVATNNTNASNTQNTETNNATWNRNAAVVANQDNLRQAQREYAAKYQMNKLGKPVFESEYSGDAFPDAFERRGVRLNVRTQNKAAISQVGDAFLRFGYALHRNWDMSNGFHYGKHFTFWKAEDIWINDGSGLANKAVSVISDILLKGVTVWKNPEEIGTVGIYDNI